MSLFSLRSALAPLAVLGLLGTAGCGKDSGTDVNPANQIAFNDYESVVGWMPPNESVTKEKAHSGAYSVKVVSPIDFGMGYSTILSKVIDHRPHKLHLEAWGYMTDAKSTARLGFQLFDLVQNKEVFGDGIDYATAIKTPGQWTKISKDITLPDNTVSTQQIRVFLWRANASSPAYVDDLRISEVPEK